MRGDFNSSRSLRTDVPMNPSNETPVLVHEIILKNVVPISYAPMSE